jgi:exodeoxyribonuclease-5
MSLTISQQKGKDHLLKFLESSNRVWTVIKGPAGTGKTFMMKDFLQSIHYSKAVAAPTHKAVRVIEQATKVKGETLHSLHGLRPNFNISDFKVGSMQFDPMGEQKLGNYKLIVIDEASQIPHGIHTLTIERAKKLGVKIIYVGDPYQLPPIGENRISRTFATQDSFELTEVVRQSKNNKLLMLLTELRSDIKNGSSRINNALLSRAKADLREMETGIQTLTRHMKPALLDEFFIDVTDIRNTRFTAWRRDTIADANLSIRSRLFPNANGMLVKGDVLTGYKTLLDSFLNTTIVNSDDYIVIDVVYRTDEKGIDGCLTTLQNMDTKKIVTVNIVNRDSPTYNNRFVPALKQAYIRAKQSTKAERRKNWIKYYAFKDSHLTLDDIYLYATDGSVYDTIQKELDYGYALTTHKLQGTTVDNIIVDLKDFQVEEYQSKFRNNLLYTALSRAKYRAYTIT